MWQKGPGEGYHAAKADALAINPKLKCRLIKLAPESRFGFIVVDEHGTTVGKNAYQAREAWSDAYFNLGGRWVKKSSKLKQEGGGR